MTRGLALSLALALATGLSLGFWLARQQTPQALKPTAVAERKPLYFRHPMNPNVTSPTPAKDEMGMDYLPVYADELAQPPAKSKLGEILYYRHPMGAADTSPTPKKDEMGMDYIPVYEGEVANLRQVTISPEKIQKLGVKAETAAPRRLVRTIRALGSVEVDERRVHAVTPKFQGWIQRLYVNATGQRVQRGQVLLDVYSPQLLTAQREYLIARESRRALEQASAQARATADQLVQNALQRLHYWDIGAGPLQRLQDQDMPLDSVPLLSPVSGVVLEKPAVAGMRFMPGELLFRIADLGRVWLLVDVYEQDLGWVRVGQTAQIHFDAYPQRVFAGEVAFIYPTLATATRTVKVRIELPNAEELLKPGLYGRVTLSAASADGERLAVPDSAILDSGTRQVVLVQKGDGLFEPRAVKLGRQADGYVEVLDGLEAGESVVTRANFLIDAESNLKSVLEGFSSPLSDEPPSVPQSSAEPMTRHPHGER